MYAQRDKAHQDAATDVAAMANGPGGAIFLGVRDDDGAAVEITPVAFSEVTELRLRQAIVSQAAPAPLFVIHRVPLAADRDRGLYLVVVPPSPYAPHAVRLNVRLGYPRRHGPNTDGCPSQKSRRRIGHALSPANSGLIGSMLCGTRARWCSHS